MTAPDIQQLCLAKVDADIKNLEDYIAHLRSMISTRPPHTEPDWALVQYLDIAENSLMGLRALRSVLKLQGPDDQQVIDACMSSEYVEGVEKALEVMVEKIAKELRIDE